LIICEAQETGMKTIKHDGLWLRVIRGPRQNEEISIMSRRCGCLGKVNLSACLDSLGTLALDRFMSCHRSVTRGRFIKDSISSRASFTHSIICSAPNPGTRWFHRQLTLAVKSSLSHSLLRSFLIFCLISTWYFNYLFNFTLKCLEFKSVGWVNR
jgi:hypothetical protein